METGTSTFNYSKTIAIRLALDYSHKSAQDIWNNLQDTGTYAVQNCDLWKDIKEVSFKSHQPTITFQMVSQEHNSKDSPVILLKLGDRQNL